MSQYGYGHSDPVGAPFDYYSGAVAVAASTPYTMQSAALVLDPAVALTVGAITLPLNPPDGCEATISNYLGSAGTITCTVAANTGDSLRGTALTSLTAGLTARYKYSLNGYVAGNSQVPGAPALNPRTWLRTA